MFSASRNRPDAVVLNCDVASAVKQYRTTVMFAGMNCGCIRSSKEPVVSSTSDFD